MIARRAFRPPPPWAWLLTAAAVALFASLAAWQWRRGEFKQRWLAQLAAVPPRPAALTSARPAPEEPALEHVVATGTYEAARQLLQDGQAHEGRPGYHVWTPLRLAGGGVVVVDRGWIPLVDDPAALHLEAPAGPLALRGYWRTLPRPGLRVAPSQCSRAGRYPAVVVYPRAADLRCILGEPVADGLLLLDPREPGGYVRQWADTGFPPERNFAYAVQWCALAVTAIVLFVILNLKRIP